MYTHESGWWKLIAQDVQKRRKFVGRIIFNSTLRTELNEIDFASRKTFHFRDEIIITPVWTRILFVMVVKICYSYDLQWILFSCDDKIQRDLRLVVIDRL